MYRECSMSNDTQYGRTLFIDYFQTGSSAKALTRIMGQPSLLPVDQIEPCLRT